ncbi:unnamed protein product, partial [marine sediment metagenome]
MKEMHRKNKMKVIVAFAVVMVFVMPVAAFANVGTFGTTPNSENTGNMENMVESTTNSDNTEETIDNARLTTGKTIYVDDDADPDWYNETQVRTITEGITNASAGDTVYVYDGIYYEHITVNRQLYITGENKENAIIDGQNNSGDVVKVTVNNVNISTFTIRNSIKPPPKVILQFTPVA